MNPDLYTFLPVGEDSLKKFDLSVKDKRELISLINESVFRKCAKTAKEKFEVLDLRDKFLKLIRFEVGNSSAQVDSSFGLLVGTCNDMCPEKERYARDYLNLSNGFETKLLSSNEVDYNLMIKEYTRSSADQDLPLSNELRPLPVLYETMLFLIDEVLKQTLFQLLSNSN